MDKLPATYRDHIQQEALRYRAIGAAQERHLVREIVAKLAIVMGPLIAIGSFFTEDVGPLGAVSGVIAAALGVLYQLDTRVSEPRRLDEMRRIEDRLRRWGVKLSANGRKAAALDGEGGRGRFLDPFDNGSYE